MTIEQHNTMLRHLHDLLFNPNLHPAQIPDILNLLDQAHSQLYNYLHHYQFINQFIQQNCRGLEISLDNLAAKKQYLWEILANPLFTNHEKIRDVLRVGGEILLITLLYQVNQNLIDIPTAQAINHNMQILLNQEFEDLEDQIARYDGQILEQMYLDGTLHDTLYEEDFKIFAITACDLDLELLIAGIKCGARLIGDEFFIGVKQRFQAQGENELVEFIHKLLTETQTLVNKQRRQQKAKKVGWVDLTYQGRVVTFKYSNEMDLDFENIMEDMHIFDTPEDELTSAFSAFNALEINQLITKKPKLVALFQHKLETLLKEPAPETKRSKQLYKKQVKSFIAELNVPFKICLSLLQLDELGITTRKRLLDKLSSYSDIEAKEYNKIAEFLESIIAEKGFFNLGDDSDCILLAKLKITFEPLLFAGAQAKQLFVSTIENLISITTITEDYIIETLNNMLASNNFEVLLFIITTKVKGMNLYCIAENRRWTQVCALLDEKIVALIGMIAQQNKDLLVCFADSPDFFNLNCSTNLIIDLLDQEDYVELQRIVEKRVFLRGKIKAALEVTGHYASNKHYLVPIFGYVEYCTMSYKQTVILNYLAVKYKESLSEHIYSILNSPVVSSIIRMHPLTQITFWKDIFSECQKNGVSNQCERIITQFLMYIDKHNLDVDKPDQDGQTILEQSVIVGNFKLVQILHEDFKCKITPRIVLATASISHEGREDLPILKYIVENYKHRRATIESTLPSIDKISYPIAGDVLVQAVLVGNSLAKVQWLIEQGCRVDAQYEDGIGLLLRLLLNTYGSKINLNINLDYTLQVAGLLLANKATAAVLATARNVQGYSTLEYTVVIPAPTEETPKIIKMFNLLLDNGANILNVSVNKQNILHVFDKTDNLGVLQHVLEKIVEKHTVTKLAEMLRQKDFTTATPLDRVANNPEKIKLMLSFITLRPKNQLV
jgi:hypothetical protein